MKILFIVLLLSASTCLKSQVNADTFHYEKVIIQPGKTYVQSLQIYIDSLKMDINSKKVPLFLLTDEIEKIRNNFFFPHTDKFSFRFELLDKLNNQELYTLRRSLKNYKVNTQSKANSKYSIIKQINLLISLK